MNPASGQYVSQFLHSLRRRMMIVRTLEAAGLGLLVAAGLSLLLALLLLAAGRDAMRLSVVALIAGACLGAAWSLRRRPTLLDAAIETDRQMNLADLLATAFTRCDASDPWQAAVIAVADQRCRNLSPADVILARFGARAWSGIGLSAALVLAVAALSASPRDSRATSADVRDGIVDPSTSAQTSVVLLPPGSSQAASPQPGIKSQPLAPEMIDDRTPGKTAMATRTSRQGSSTGAGSNSAKTPLATVPQVTPVTSPGTPSTPRGVEAAGGGRGSDPSAPNSDQAVSAEAAASISPAKSSPPWNAATWSQDRAAAGRAVQDGRVPDSYRDILQRYFQPE